MGLFFAYILKSAICLALFYLFYRLLLSKETFHRFNRVALLGILLLSLLIPLIEVTTTQHTEMAKTMLTLEQLLIMANFYQDTASVTTPVEANSNTLSGIQIGLIIYLAGIQGVSQSYLEAATVDGANAWERFRFIILPLLVPALSSSVIYNLIGGLKLYDVIIALTDGGPAKKTHSLATYIANRYFDAERAGYAAAIGVFSFVMIMIISMIVNAYFRKKEVDL